MKPILTIEEASPRIGALRTKRNSLLAKAASIKAEIAAIRARQHNPHLGSGMSDRVAQILGSQ